MNFRPIMLAAAMAAVPLAALAPAAANAQTAPMMHAANTPMLSFALTEEVRSAPDRASLGAGVTTQAATATEALRLNTAAMDKLIAAIKAKGVKAVDMQTSGFSLSPQYDYSPTQAGGQPRFIGYQVSNQLRITTKEIDKIGMLLDTMIAAGGTNVDGPAFSVADPDAALEPARANLLKKAMTRAQRYAQLAGFKKARLVSINEGGIYGGPQPPMVMNASAEMAGKSVPIEPGRVANALTVHFQFVLEN